MFAHGAQSVKCAVCNNVTAVTGSSLLQAHSVAQRSDAPQRRISVHIHGVRNKNAGVLICLFTWLSCSLPDSSAAAASGSGTQTLTQSVVVENPPSLDKDGNEVIACAVGFHLTDVRKCLFPCSIR